MDLLFEIGVAEMPARFCAAMAEALRDRIVSLCEREGLAETLGPDGARAQAFVTPRRIAVVVKGVRSRQEDRSEEALGPPAKAAFDAEGKPTRAAEGFARSKGGRPEDLRRVRTERGEYAALTIQVPGRTAGEVLAEGIPAAVTAIPLPIAMRWGEGEGPFLRPVRWVVALLGEEVVPVSLFGLRAGRESRGHRVTGGGRPAGIASPGAYADTLRTAGVEPDAARRTEAIRAALHAAAGSLSGSVDLEEAAGAALLVEVVHLTEQPSVIAGSIDARSLSLPEEVLVTAMGHHQKFFAVRDARGKLLPHFLAVLNAAGDPEGAIRRGCEEVLRARLEDARFFFVEDRKSPLADAVSRLDRVVFQEKLGSVAAKSARMLRGVEGMSTGTAESDVRRAIALARADLVTRMVGEFPELQGIVGGVYARLDGEPPAVGDAIYDFYRPAGVDDPLPRGSAGRATALLDRIDTLVGCLGVGVEVSGSKDPFGLRRAALAAARLLVERPETEPPLLLTSLVAAAARACSEVPGFDATRGIAGSAELIENRLRHLFESQGYAPDEIAAVLAAEPGGDDPRDASLRLRALREVRGEGKLEALAVPFKRIRNILRGETVPEGRPREGETDSPALALWDLHDALVRETSPLLEKREYAAALRALARIGPPLDEFFVKVLVMHEDPQVRAARLRLLRYLRSLFLRILDPSEIAGGAAADVSH